QDHEHDISNAPPAVPVYTVSNFNSLLGMAASVMKDLAAASTNEVSRLRGKVVEVAIKAHASGTKRTARAGGIAKNAENAAMKAEVFRWLDRHLSEYQGRLDAAADAIEAAKLVPLTWRTIRNYITDYNKLQKQLQSAGTQ
ncbi:hypothetical protein, partial [Burkholderia ubonensis]|uniref:hypothetical protein n=1 Tax=Burkholderia ubonensis TaxID=101571 RepID=UPI0012FA1CDB